MPVAKPTITTIERSRLIEALDTLADVAQVIECAVDDGRPLDDPDAVIARLRGVISDLVFDLEASDLLDAADPGPHGEEAP